MNILELGSYIIPAYAGYVLAGQGQHVTKWVSPTRPDPIEGMRRGGELWAWINHGKHVERRHAATIAVEPPGRFTHVVDNIRAATWKDWAVDPAAEADRLGVTWVSMRDDFDDRSFDAIAQARAWGDHAGCVPFYIGDTAAGLWLAFKAATAPPGHHVLRQAACLAKLVEGELAVTERRDGPSAPWDQPGTYGPDGDGVTVVYRGVRHHEPFRDDRWRLANLAHEAGRLLV